jgi:hypothetical protein
MLGGETLVAPLPGEVGVPLRVWFDSSDDAVLWMETTTPLGDAFEVIAVSLTGTEAQIMTRLASAPEMDTEAFVRIGRIPAPLAITATQAGLVRLWDLETGAVTAEAQLEVAPVFGRVNETTGRQLAWRDPQSETLQVLDFETGENRLVATLDGAYIQALMLTPAADVVLAVHIGDAAVVAAWTVDDGARIDLGAYRICTRVPDMVQLSLDGTTLVIGCDTGLEVWRVG